MATRTATIYAAIALKCVLGWWAAEAQADDDEMKQPQGCWGRVMGPVAVRGLAQPSASHLPDICNHIPAAIWGRAGALGWAGRWRTAGPLNPRQLPRRGSTCDSQ